MSLIDRAALVALADELQRARIERQTIVAPPSVRAGADGSPTFDLDAAYAVERELAARRHAEGRRSVGRKVGYASKAVWRALKLETLVWAGMYDDTVRFSERNRATLPLPVPDASTSVRTPKIEPELVFKMRRALAPGTADPGEVLASVEWIALGFEIIDCPYPDWKFQPADFVAAYGFHAALIVGEPREVRPEACAVLSEALSGFTVTLACDGEVVEKGGGRNSLRSPALCLGELATAISRRPGADRLLAGELVSSGTLTESRLLAPGQTWTAEVDGLDLPPLTLQLAGG